MKNFVQSFLLITLFSCTLFAGSGSISERPGPFPWGTEIAFPWDDIEGLWQAREDHSLFEFTMGRPGPFPLRIRHYYIRENGAVRLIAERMCVRGENDKIIDCLLIGRQTSYRVLVRAYEDKGDKTHGHEHSERALIVTLRPVSGDSSEDIHLWMDKVF